MIRLPCFCACLVLLSCLWATGLAAHSFGQPVSVPDSLEARLRAGIAAYESGRFAAAQKTLATVFRAEPAFQRAEVGSAAYWLGQTYRARSHPADAATVWYAGWSALTQQGHLDVRLVDALIWTIIEQQETRRYPAATAAYLTLLGHLDGALPASLHAIRDRHLVPLLYILPAALKEETGLTNFASARQGLRDGAGERLVAWWRSMDLLPASSTHERLLEHLQRIAYARAHYADSTADAGFDARGEVYVRLGPPSHQTELLPGIQDPEVPRGIFWVYRHVHEAAQYLFVKEWNDQGYRLGHPEDLIPPKLRVPGRTMQLLALLEDIYRDLALYNPRGHFGSVYERIADYRLDAATRFHSSSLYPIPETMQTPVRMEPMAFAQTAFGEARMRYRRAAHQRDEAVPPSFSNLFDDIERLPLDLRWARFLDEDGSTRTEVYWSLPAEATRPSQPFRARLTRAGYEPSDDVLLAFSAVQHAADYRQRNRLVKSYLIRMPAEQAGAGGILAPKTFTTRRDTGRYHLAFQWDVFWANRADDGIHVRRGAQVKIASVQLDSLEALDHTPDRLEMSDLKPLRPLDARQPLAEAPPYPHRIIVPDLPLALYFEIYHLAYGADDRTHYTIAYEIERTDERNGLHRLLRKGTRRTTSQTSYEGHERIARETIRLDLSEWEDPGTLTVTVRVTDETTGQHIERALSFEMHSSSLSSALPAEDL